MAKLLDGMNKPELMTHFDKWVMKAVGVLTVAGVVGAIAFMTNINTAIARVETSIVYLSDQMKNANRDRYTLNMAAIDKAFFNAAMIAQNKKMDTLETKILRVEDKIITLEKDLIRLTKN